MQLRKYVVSVTTFTLCLPSHIRCLQHPYLYDDDIEPRGLAPEETHEKLIDASTKFRLLKLLLPKLRARGHRVLLFSQVNYSLSAVISSLTVKKQFVIALDIIEDFLQGEGFKYLRLVCQPTSRCHLTNY